MRKSFFRSNTAAVLFLSTAAVLWFGSVIFSGNIFAARDLGRYFYPLRKFGAEAVKSFHIPLWNPYLSCGKPFLAVLQTAVFYPLSLIYYLFPSFDSAFNWYIVTHLFLASLFMYCLMRHWGFSLFPSIVSAIVFAYSGYLSSVITMNSTLGSVAWLPAVFLFYDKALSSLKLKYVFITAVFLGMEFLGGIPTPLYGTFWMLLAYTVFYIRINPKKARAYKMFLIFPAVFLLFLLLFMFQILPFAELLRNSNLAGGRSFEAVSKWSLTPVELLAFAVPYIRGDINVPAGSIGPQEWLISLYTGVLAVIFAAVLFALRPSKRAYFWGGVFLCSLVIILGRYTPVYGILYRFVPGIRSIRYPVKFIFITVFSVSILSGMGACALVKEGADRKKQRITKGLILLNLVSALLLGLFIYFWRDLGDYLMKLSFAGKDVTGDLFNKYVFVYLNDTRYICRFFIVFTGAVSLIVMYLRRRISRGVFSLLAVLFIFGDLFSVNAGIVKVMNRRHFSLMPESVKKVKEDKSLYRVFQTKGVWDINRSLFGLSYTEGMFSRMGTFACNMAMKYGIYHTRGYGSIEADDWYRFILFLDKEETEKVRMKLLGLLNVKYIISEKPFSADNAPPVYKGIMDYCTTLDGRRVYRYFYIYKNNLCLPRAFLADTAVPACDKSVVLGIMANKNFDPKKAVIIDADIVPAYSGGETEYEGAEYAAVTSYRPEDAVITAAAKKRRWLILSDTYYPGWKAFIDGRETRIYKADYFLKAVSIPPGRHTVEFAFSPRSFTAGCIVSIFSFLCVILALILPFYLPRS